MDRLTDHSARRWLCRAGDELASGWTVITADPEARTRFERHLEAVGDAVRCEVELVERRSEVSELTLLAGHAYDVRARAADAGWRVPSSRHDWTPDEWFGLRILACYGLATTCPRGPRMPRFTAARGLIARS